MPKTHIKPTKEELDEKINESVEKLDKADKELLEKVNKTSVEEAPKEEPEVAPEEAPKEEPKKEDYKKKFSESSREAQILYTKNKKIAEAIEKAGDVKEPTEEEMAREYPDWEVMSDFERKMAKKDVMNTRKFDAIEEATRDFKDIDAWAIKVDDFLSDPETLTKTPELEGKEEEFRIFSTKPSRRGIDFEDLVSSFLYMDKVSVKPKSKGSMFPTGSPGINERPQPKTDTISVEESRRLRVVDYKKYLQYVREGKIDNSSL